MAATYNIPGLSSTQYSQIIAVLKSEYIFIPIQWFFNTNELPTNAGGLLGGLTNSAFSSFSGFMSTLASAGVQIPIRIYNAKYSEQAEAKVSNFLLLDQSGGKRFVTDNVAPQPRTFSIEGFISPLAVSLNPFGTYGSIVDNLVFSPTLNWSVDTLWNCFYGSKVFTYRDAFGRFHSNTAFRSLKIAKDPSIQSDVRIIAEIQELPLYSQAISPMSTKNPATAGSSQTGFGSYLP